MEYGGVEKSLGNNAAGEALLERLVIEIKNKTEALNQFRRGSRST